MLTGIRRFHVLHINSHRQIFFYLALHYLEFRHTGMASNSSEVPFKLSEIFSPLISFIAVHYNGFLSTEICCSGPVAMAFCN